MATERTRLLRALASLPALVMLMIPHVAHADQAWWQPLAFSGQRVDAVSAMAGRLVVHLAAGAMLSTDGGRTFSPTLAAPVTGTTVVSGGFTWAIHAGVVVTGASSTALRPDPGAPYLGASAHLLAAPAALPGVVVAVGSDDHVWRRSPSGSWATSFVLLPAGGLAGVPRVTALAAFTEPLTVAVYLGVDGYGVLLTDNGGDDWIRADPGLPANVLALATDPMAKALYAATDQGLFVHHLQSFPAPPTYRDSALVLRWLGIAIVAVLATALALLGLRRLL